MQLSHKTLTIFNLIGSAVFIALSLDIPESLIRFLLVGELPDGTTLLSPDAMLAIITLGFIVTLAAIIPSLSLKAFSKLIRSPAKLRLPKHRYTSLQ